jgi:septal ring factor EnvC (AmiA/AmiB activator)
VERSAARQKLNALRREIERNESVKSDASDALAASEAAISGANRSLRELTQEQAQIEARLASLAQQQAALAKTVQRQQQQLAALLRDQHVAGSEDRIKLLLSGDNPNRINRDLQYLGYVSQAQAKLLGELRANLQTVEANQAASQNARDELAEIADEAKSHKTVLENEKRRRATLLVEVSGKLAEQRKEAGHIERDEQRLGGLVEKLAKLIEEQRKAEAIEQEKQRKALAAAEARKLQAAKEREQKEQAAREQRAALAKNNTPARGKPEAKAIPESRPAPVEVIEAPPKVLAKNELTPQAGGTSAAFASLRGQLRLPVKGELTAKFGSKRGEGQSWKGLFIRAAEGSDIKAVAGGTVVFADWLRGFGNLIIVDHGNQYMTIYGNNQSVLKHAGDAVKAGDSIASVGNSGGNEQSGLYFEMRHQGRAIDPLDWVSLK